jgi:DNA-binding protein HU-beta
MRGDSAMTQRIEKPTLVTLVANRTSRDTALVEEIIEATLEEIYAALKRGESDSLRNFGSFYVRQERESWVFKFNPRSACGRSSVGHRPTGETCSAPRLVSTRCFG